ncbi:MAG: hypothetical protein LBW85_01935 [Deltaproteobacteria bacterium]|jgi:hypothetical protein|nr:hypothetical protein [Deltaproteobacteria bacterium]
MDLVRPNDEIRVGGEIEARCSKCKRTTTHRIVSMQEDKVKNVMCLACNGTHKYYKPAEPAPAKAVPAKPKVTRKKAAAPPAASGEAAEAAAAKPKPKAKAAPKAQKEKDKEKAEQPRGPVLREELNDVAEILGADVPEIPEEDDEDDDDSLTAADLQAGDDFDDQEGLGALAFGDDEEEDDEGGLDSPGAREAADAEAPEGADGAGGPAAAPAKGEARKAAKPKSAKTKPAKTKDSKAKSVKAKVAKTRSAKPKAGESVGLVPPEELQREWEERVGDKAASSRQLARYTLEGSFSAGQVFSHDVFGPGYVRAVLAHNKIQVNFNGAVKTLVMNVRPASGAGEPPAQA